jgi:hypothetical protein
MSRKQRKKKKKILRITILSILCIAVLVSSTMYFYPRIMLTIRLNEKIKELGEPQKFEIAGDYFGETEWMDTEWLSVEIPLEYGVIDIGEVTEDEKGAYYSGSGINLFVSREGVIAEDSEKADDSLSFIWANTKHEYELALYKTVYQMPSIIMPMEELQKRADEYILFTALLAKKRYCYYETNGLGCTILNTQDEHASIYSINIYDLNNNLNLVGQITLSYDIGASRDPEIEDRGVGLVINSRTYFNE